MAKFSTELVQLSLFEEEQKRSTSDNKSKPKRPNPEFAGARNIEVDDYIPVERRPLTAQEKRIQDAIDEADAAYITFCDGIRHSIGEQRIRELHQAYLLLYDYVAELICGVKI